MEPNVDIALVYPYFLTNARHAMPFHPLGIAQLAAILRRDGQSVAVVDTTFMTPEEAADSIVALRPRVVGVYVMLSLSGNAFRLAEELRRRLPGVLLACGGPLPTVKPSLFAVAFDAVFRGEADESFPRFCADYLVVGRPADGGLPTGAYPGLCTAGPDGAMRETPPEPSDERRLAGLPLPDRTDFDHASYQRHWRAREGFAPAGIMTAYGCPNDCDFCSRPVFGRRYRRRPVPLVIEEVRQVKGLGYDALWIADDAFLIDLEHARGFCRALAGARLGMRWSCLARVDGVSEEDVLLMGEAGCRKVYFGLESGDDAVLRLMNKKATVAQAEATVRRFARHGVETSGFFMVGYPGETAETVERTLAWALSLPLDEVSFTIPYPLPGTPLYDRVGGVDDSSDWSHENENRLLYRSDFEEGYLQRRIEETYERFRERRQAR